MRVCLWRFVLGLVVLLAVLGIPLVKMIRTVAHLTGWTNTLRGLGASLLFSVALWLGVWLLISSIRVKEQQ